MEKIFIVFCETPGNPHYTDSELVIPIGEGDSKTLQVTDTDIIARAKRGIFKGKGEA